MMGVLCSSVQKDEGARGYKYICDLGLPSILMLNMFFFMHDVCSTEPLLIPQIIFPSVDIPVELFNKPDCEYTDDQKQFATT